MLGLVSRLNQMSPGQVFAIFLVAAIILGIAAVVFIQNREDGEGGVEVALEEGQQLVQVRRGDLVNQVSSSGSIVFPNREELTFGISGTIGEIMVAEGDNVSQGQDLARMDGATIAGLERDVAQAEVDLQRSIETLEELLEPVPYLLIAEAKSAIARARFDVQRAEESLAEVEDPFTQEEIDEALADVESAKEDLVDAWEDVQATVDDHAEKVQTAVDALDVVRVEYQDVVQNYLGQTLTEADYTRSPEEFFDTYGIDLITFFSDDRLEDAVISVLPLEPGPMSELDDPETPWDEFTVYRWIVLYPGAIYGDCEGIVTAPQDVCVLQDMERSWSKVDKAQDAVNTARDNAVKAEDNAKKAVDQAEEALDRAEEKLEEVYVTSDDVEIEVKYYDANLARARLEEAEKDYEELAADDPPDPLTITLREAQITANEAALERAKERLGLVVLTAPFSGTVTAVNVEEGRSIAGNNTDLAIMEIVDQTVAEVDARLDEIDVLTVREGMEAIVALDGLPGAGLPGVVAEISRTGENQQGVVTYPIRISVRTPPVLQLREGLTATAEIVLQQEADVLLIPTTSLAGSIEQPTVLVSVGGELMERNVTIGASDGFWVVVTDGVNEGERLVSTGGGGSENFANLGRIGGLGGLGGAAGIGGRGQGLTPEQRQAIRDRIRAQGGAGAGAGGRRGQGAGQ